MTHHIPTIADCKSQHYRPRYWMSNMARPMTLDDIEASRWCRAFHGKEQRAKLQGNACDGCLRIPEEQR